MTVSYGRGPKGVATRLHAQLVRARGRCEYCDSTANLQCAHIISRRYSRTRTDLANAFCLCAKCHAHFTDHPVDFGVFAVSKIGRDAYDDLYRRAHGDGKVDWDAEVERLRAILKGVET